MSIATKHGDTGTTALIGGFRLSKSDIRVDSYGTVDELNTVLGFARSICTETDIAAWTEEIQRKLFSVGAALSTAPESRRPEPYVKQADVDFLTELVYQIEATEGILSDWSLPGANTQSAAYEMARTVCRRAERIAVALQHTGAIGDVIVEPEVLAFLNRLSDLIWLFGRLIEVRAGQNTSLRDDTKDGPNFSRAW